MFLHRPAWEDRCSGKQDCTRAQTPRGSSPGSNGISRKRRKAINRTRLSCKGMARNEVRLQLHASACNPGVLLQGADLPEEMADRSLTGLRTRLIRTGARIVRHARAITFQPAGAAVGGALFTRILAAIQRLRASAIPANNTGMTVSAIKPGRKRLDGSDPTGAGRTEFRFKPVAAAINRARFTNRMPEPIHVPPKRLDLYAKQRQHDRNGILIGECRVNHSSARFDRPVGGCRRPRARAPDPCAASDFRATQRPTALIRRAGAERICGFR